MSIQLFGGIMKKIVVFVLALLLIMPSMSFASDAQTYGEILKDLGLISGSDKGLQEDKGLQRQEMVILLNKLYADQAAYINFVAPKTPSFSDVPTTHWAYKDIEFAKAYNITSGIGNGKFGIGLPITNNQAAFFFANILGFGNFDGEMEFNDAYLYMKNNIGIDFQRLVDGSVEVTRGEVFEMMAKALFIEDKSGTPRLKSLDIPAAKKSAFEDAAMKAKPYTVYSNINSLTGVDLLKTLELSYGSDANAGYAKIMDSKVKIEDGLLVIAEAVKLDHAFDAELLSKYIEKNSFEKVKTSDYQALKLTDIALPVMQSNNIMDYEGELYADYRTSECTYYINDDDAYVYNLYTSSENGMGDEERTIAEIFKATDKGNTIYVVTFDSEDTSVFDFQLIVVDGQNKFVAGMISDAYITLNSRVKAE